MINFKLDPLIEDELRHYGVKGMTWGVRKDEYKKRRATRRAEKADKLDAKSKAYRSKANATGNEAFQKKADRWAKDAQRTRDGKLTTNQRRVAAGAAIVAAYAAYRVVDSGDARRLISKGREAITGEAFNFKRNFKYANKDFSPEEIMENVVPGINGKYGSPGTVNNCRRCTFAYVMRRQGYDVSATRTMSGNGQTGLGYLNATNPNEKQFRFTGSRVASAGDVLRRYSKNEKEQNLLAKFNDKLEKNKVPPNKLGVSTSIFEALKNQPDGAIGEVEVNYKMGGGHSIAWERIGGKTVLFDTQSSKMIKNVVDFEKYMPAFTLQDASVSRLDNIQLNQDFLMKWVKNDH